MHDAVDWTVFWMIVSLFAMLMIFAGFMMIKASNLGDENEMLKNYIKSRDAERWSNTRIKGGRHRDEAA